MTNMPWRPGSAAEAVAYIRIADDQQLPFFGVGTDHDIIVASVKAVLSGVNRWLTSR